MKSKDFLTLCIFLKFELLVATGNFLFFFESTRIFGKLVLGYDTLLKKKAYVYLQMFITS